ncbi:class I SAM-dependent methyltransferase [Sphingomonas koreensis]|nr:class I SAM-dependent methyltransferase [Sphingomonas koreensis]
MAREFYGVDAPTVVRNLALGGLACIALWAVSLIPHLGFLRNLRPTFQGAGIGMIVGASWMLASSLWLKRIVRDRLLASRRWHGDERALDVGRGRGLVAVGIARRLGAHGRVHGLDLWQAADLSGNTPQRALANAAAAGAADRIVIDTGDMRALPYPDHMFNVVASMTAIHNVPGRLGRAQAISEMWRVTKPGGEILVFDIRHARSYAAQLRLLGAQVKTTGPIFLWGPLGWRFSAEKPN